MTEAPPTPADLGVALTDAPPTTVAPSVPLGSLARIALRRNPKRAHLLVSTVLAKHLPTVPAVALTAGEALAARVADVLDGGSRWDTAAAARLERVVGAAAAADAPDGDTAAAAGPTGADPATLAVHRAATTLRTDLAALRPEHPDTLVLGFAETATALGAMVAEALGAAYLHSTRHDPPGAVPAAGFDEAHSHATAHRLLPADPDWLPDDGTVVLVDDELSTGATARATIRALHALAPQRRWVVAGLIDLRSAADVTATEALAAEIGAPVTVVALGRGDVVLPADLAHAASAVVAAHAVAPTDARDLSDAHRIETGEVSDGRPVAAPPRASRPTAVTTVTAPPTAVDRTGTPARRVRLPRTDVEGIARDVVAALGDAPRRVLVLGTEEHMHTPLVVADAIRRQSDADVRFSTTTRSPVAVLDDPAWPIRSGVRFRSHDATVDGPGERFAYNVHGFDAIVVLPEPGTERDLLDGADGLLAALLTAAPTVVLVRAPLDAHDGSGVPRPLTGPSFGSYEPDDVTWLLQDLAGAALEADTADRERAIQLDGANYAESLPVEYVPSDEYEALYRDALDRSAERIAEAVGIVTELILRGRPRPVLVSLARAGTPIGILVRRWAEVHHGLRLPHYTASIVRGVGLDETALRWLAAHHDPSQVVFVDGWTGKGAITRELTEALNRFAASDGVRFADDLAVLADPAGCTPLHGTRDDYLVPSACLNSTVSGLVSRTVRNPALTPDGTFHGAKQYRDLAPRDHSRAFVAAIADRFDAVRDRVDAALAATGGPEGSRAVDWRGMRTVEAIGSEYGIDDLHLVKPGVGETTRVLLRRVPWQVLVRDPDDVDIAHVVALARERGVPVVTRPDLSYSCIGLIHPLGSRVAGSPAGTGSADAVAGGAA
ncbi:phosphoribosyltransferase domain-containing protein [Curtobacterium sp. VKM Ac-1393]|uniref:phosphoribosyltransferase domain-containing protein n=1 Tax=Curtobacterium sp. VKM Ac-1393 TaxID=2783814 RepID=UPI00188D85B8|nr:phosphoribosyltransferase domain-containing protein [Curtobacterium sp. VKM Ac-1393]MBF4608270.1 phosphoribosyltransferase domain-containing protein [Curtobacterium sp. VKM Ac-1393]